MGGGGKGKHSILPSAVGELLFGKPLAKTALFKTEVEGRADVWVSSWDLSTCPRSQRRSPMLLIRELVLTSPQPFAFGTPHTPLWSFLQQLLGRKECFLLCFLLLHLQAPNSSPGCSACFSSGRPSLRRKELRANHHGKAKTNQQTKE